MGPMKKAGAVAAALALVVGLAACGDDDDTGTADDGGAVEADPAAFCDTLIEFNGAVMEVDLEDEASEDEVKEVGSRLAPLFQELADNAPDALGGGDRRAERHGDPALARRRCRGVQR